MALLAALCQLFQPVLWTVNITLLPVGGMGILVTFLLLRSLTETSQKQNNSNVIVVNGFFQGVAFHVELMFLR